MNLWSMYSVSWTALGSIFITLFFLLESGLWPTWSNYYYGKNPDYYILETETSYMRAVPEHLYYSHWNQWHII